MLNFFHTSLYFLYSAVISVFKMSSISSSFIFLASRRLSRYFNSTHPSARVFGEIKYRDNRREAGKKDKHQLYQERENAFVST